MTWLSDKWFMFKMAIKAYFKRREAGKNRPHIYK